MTQQSALKLFRNKIVDHSAKNKYNNGIQTAGIEYLAA
jgi:hypothetical protein